MLCHIFAPHSLVYGFVLMPKLDWEFGHFRIQHYHGCLSDPDKLLGKN
jgi:hypothetical protein